MLSDTIRYVVDLCKVHLEVNMNNEGQSLARIEDRLSNIENELQAQGERIERSHIRTDNGFQRQKRMGKLQVMLGTGLAFVILGLTLYPHAIGAEPYQYKI